MEIVELKSNELEVYCRSDTVSFEQLHELAVTTFLNGLFAVERVDADIGNKPTEKSNNLVKSHT